MWILRLSFFESLGNDNRGEEAEPAISMLWKQRLSQKTHKLPVLDASSAPQKFEQLGSTDALQTPDRMRRGL